MGVALNSQARHQFRQYLQNISTANGVDNTAERFNVQPVPQQKIISAYQKSAEFLQMINVITVDDAHGQKLGLSVGSVASNTNTLIQPRRPTAMGAIDELDQYLCTQTNYDVAYLYALLNAWSHQPNFQVMLAQMVVKAIALDKIKIGFNGLERRATTDKNAYPMLQDVNIGWLEKIRIWAPERVYAGEDQGGIIKTRVGAGQTFKTIDALVETGINEFIAEQHRESPLVAICGRGILNDKYLPMMNQVLDPTEQLAVRNIYANKQLGTLPAMHVPNFPSGKILITSADNLSIYIQNGSIRRHIKDEPEWDRLADYQCANEAFVVEDYEKCCLLENVEYV